MTNIRLLLILVLLLLAFSVHARLGKKAREQRKKRKQRKKAKMANSTSVIMANSTSVNSTSPVITIGVGGGPFAPSYAGFFCGPADEGEEGIMNKCQQLSICKFKRIENGDAGKIITGELVQGQGDCMRRCDTRFGMSEEIHCGPGEKCHSFILGCPCPNLNDEKCHPYYDD
jgi:hypothetical protein